MIIARERSHDITHNIEDTEEPKIEGLVNVELSRKKKNVKDAPKFY